MNKNISFSQYKEIYLSRNDENDNINLKDNTKSSWGFYTNIEAGEPIPQLINRSLTKNLDIDINEINDSLLDNQIIVAAFYPSNFFFKICLPIAIIIILY